MGEAACSEAAKTDLPTPKRTRRKRLALRLAAVVVAASALGAAYWFTRPPELVWWRSPAMGKSGIRVKMLIPWGWQVDPRWNPRRLKVPPAYVYGIYPIDPRPKLLRRILPYKQEGVIGLELVDIKYGMQQWSHITTTKKITIHISGNSKGVDEIAMFEKAQVAVIMDYYRTGPAFNRTYERICNSLRIE